MSAPTGELDDHGAGSLPAPRPGRRKKPPASPKQQALALLVRREHSQQELTRKLRAKGISREDAREAVSYMQDNGWQSNARFAESLARSRAMQGYGPLRIRAELGSHGIERALIDDALTALQQDWSAHAAELVRRRFGERPGHDPATRLKAADYLLRRGFTLTQMRHALQHDDGAADLDDYDSADDSEFDT